MRREVVGGWRRLHVVELPDFYSSPNITRVIKTRRMRWVGHVACLGQIRNACKILIIKPEGKKPLVRHRQGWEYYIRMDLREIGWEGVTGCIWLRMGTSGRLF
jgi:hypothetical protein